MPAMNNMKNHKIVAHIHDEVIIEAKPDDKTEAICEQIVILSPPAPS